MKHGGGPAGRPCQIADNLMWAGTRVSAPAEKGMSSMVRGTKGIAVKGLICGVLFLFLGGVAPSPCPARVSKEMKCSVCHTMHNSQAGEPMAYEYSGGAFDPKTTPNVNLLVTDCVGCHTALDGSTWKDGVTGAPIVFNTAQPNYGADAGDGKHVGLAAGNFYWVTQDQSFGHDIFTRDPKYTTAPGRFAVGCDADTDCHSTLTYVGAPCAHCRTLSPCGNCHMVTGDASNPSNVKWHHRDDSGPVIDSVEEGWYRFIAGHNWGDGYGAAGIEDPDWEHSPSSTVHNEYLGYEDNKKNYDGGFAQTPANTVSAFCMGCHNEFHHQDESTSGASPWLLHPSDAEIPNSGEYTGYTTYDPLAPVARPSLSSVSPTVTPGQDLVFCLSCHRAHAGPYYKMLRWDITSSNLATALQGCSVCHTAKY